MAAEDRITLEIRTPEGRSYLEQASSVVLPGKDGSYGVLANHAPMMAAVGWGVLEYESAGKRYKVAVSDGFAEVLDNHVLVMVHTAEKGEDIDKNRARKALERARQRMAEHKPGTDQRRAKMAIIRALTRLKACDDQMGNRSTYE